MHNSKKFGLTINEIKKDGFKIFKTFDMLPKSDSGYSMAMSLAEGIQSFAKAFKIISPDINLVLGDRDEMFASSLAAYHMNIPNAHIHGGDKTQGGIDEYTRHAITKISNIHFAATKNSFHRILKLGENKKYVFLSGSPSIDEIKQNKISTKSELEKKYHMSITGNEILLLYHPVTTQTENTESQISIILSAIKKLHKPTIAISPNSDAGHKIIFSKYEHFSKNNIFFSVHRSLPRNDYLGFLKYCGVLLGNSSSGMIEASYFKTPVINIGIRQNGRDRGNNVIDILTPTTASVSTAILKAIKMKSMLKKPTQIYGNGSSSKKIVDILEKIKLDKKLIQKQIMYDD